MVGRETEGGRCRCKEEWSCCRPGHWVFRVVVASYVDIEGRRLKRRSLLSPCYYQRADGGIVAILVRWRFGLVVRGGRSSSLALIG